MSYCVNAISKYGSFTDWFMNAVHNAFEKEDPNSFIPYNDVFKKHYGYPVLTNDFGDPTLSWEVEFPSEAEATMFLLRWSY